MGYQFWLFEARVLFTLWKPDCFKMYLKLRWELIFIAFRLCFWTCTYIFFFGAYFTVNGLMLCQHILIIDFPVWIKMEGTCFLNYKTHHYWDLKRAQRCCVFISVSEEALPILSRYFCSLCSATLRFIQSFLSKGCSSKLFAYDKQSGILVKCSLFICSQSWSRV